MAQSPYVTDEDLVVIRVQARALAKRLARQAEAGELRCDECGAPLDLDRAVVLLLECGHEVIVVPCSTEGCGSAPGKLFEPRGVSGHAVDHPGVPLPLSAWLRL
jgi:hypothetical protein